MRLSRVVPLISFGAFALCALVALRSHDEYAPPFRTTAAAAEIAPPVFVRGAATLSGTIVASGASVPDALVVVWEGERLWWTNVGADGRFAFTGLSAGEHDVSVVADGYPTLVAQAIAGDEAATLDLGAPLPSAPQIPAVQWIDLAGSVAQWNAGEATDYELLFVPAAPEEFRVGVVPRRAQVDRRGEFLVSRLAPARYRVSLLPSWARGGTEPDLLVALGQAPIEFEHVADTATPNPLELPLLAAVIRGTVTQSRYAEDGSAFSEPIEGVLVQVQARGEYAALIWPPTTTTRDGTYTVPDLPTGSYDVRMLFGTVDIEKTVTVTPGASLQVDFELP